MGDHEKDGGQLTAAGAPDVARFDPQRLLATARFLTGAADASGLPAATLDEIAFAGRSNVGKSSLINALTRQRNLARTSRTPGRTQQINFFEIGSEEQPAGRLVDLPGYGFARAPKADVANWSAFTRDFLMGRATLKRVFLLIDARHGIKRIDQDLMALLNEAGVSYQLVTTKTDKITSEARDRLRDDLASRLAKQPAAHPDILLTSAKKAMGIADLAAQIGDLLGRASVEKKV